MQNFENNILAGSISSAKNRYSRMKKYADDAKKFQKNFSHRPALIFQ
jgi:hypothetical protein